MLAFEIHVNGKRRCIAGIFVKLEQSLSGSKERNPNTDMKVITTGTLLIAAISMLAGCASPQRGIAYGHEQEFRRQLAQSIPMKEYGYTIKELRFTPDYKK